MVFLMCQVSCSHAGLILTCLAQVLVPGQPLHAVTAQTRQRLFFSICDHNSSSFAIENNWVRPHPPERSSKIGIWIEKFRCQNSNLNLPTIKNGFYGYSYLKDPLCILKRICAQFWNCWVIPVMWVCLDSATTQNSWRTIVIREILYPNSGSYFQHAMVATLL